MAIARAQMALPTVLACRPPPASVAWMIKWVFHQPDLAEASDRDAALRAKFVSMSLSIIPVQ